MVNLLSHPLTWNLTGGPFERKMVFQDPVRFHVDLWEGDFMVAAKVPGPNRVLPTPLALPTSAEERGHPCQERIERDVAWARWKQDRHAGLPKLRLHVL